MNPIEQWPELRLGWPVCLTAVRAIRTDTGEWGEIALTDKYFGWRGWITAKGSPLDCTRYHVVRVTSIRDVEVKGYRWGFQGELRFLFRDPSSGVERSYSFQSALAAGIVQRCEQLGVPVIGQDKENLTTFKGMLRNYAVGFLYLGVVLAIVACLIAGFILDPIRWLLYTLLALFFHFLLGLGMAVWLGLSTQPRSRR